jgi:hypothetical protein
VIIGGYRLTHPAVSQPSSLGSFNGATTPSSTTIATTLPSHTYSGPVQTIYIIDRRANVWGISVDVARMECGLRLIGPTDAQLAASPGSRWCLVRVNVKNISSSPSYWSAGGQVAYDTRGDSFTSESDALLYVSNPNVGPLNPGLSEPDIIPFELPTSDKLTKIDLYAGNSVTPVVVPLYRAI